MQAEIAPAWGASPIVAAAVAEEGPIVAAAEEVLATD
jgi:hypothetical protein